jgi:U3 small nucleolar RNA-associated protein 14
MQDLLHVEEKSEKKINKIKTKSFREIGGKLLVLLENLNELGLVKVIL